MEFPFWFSFSLFWLSLLLLTGAFKSWVEGGWESLAESSSAVESGFSLEMVSSPASFTSSSSACSVLVLATPASNGVSVAAVIGGDCDPERKIGRNRTKVTF